MKFLKTVFWSILTVVALYYTVEAAVVSIGHYHKQIGNNKKALNQFTTHIKLFKKGIWINSSKREIKKLKFVIAAKANKKEKKSDNYKSYGTIYKSSKEKISNIQSKYNEKLREELSQ